MRGTHCLGLRAQLLRLRAAKYCIRQIQAHSTSSQWFSDSCLKTDLQIIADPKGLLFIAVISINAYHFKKKN